MIQIYQEQILGRVKKTMSQQSLEEELEAQQLPPHLLKKDHSTHMNLYLFLLKYAANKIK